MNGVLSTRRRSWRFYLAIARGKLAVWIRRLVAFPSSMSDYRPSTTLLIWLVLAGLLLPLIYILSIGPVFWLTSQGYLSPSVEAIYFPLGLLSRLSPSTQDALDWYIGLFQ
jgi:hypothetical protein